MARRSRAGNRKRGRGAVGRLILRGAALVVLIGVAFAGWLWWDMREWRPDPTLYPEQGALVPPPPYRTNMVTLKAIGAQFAYLPLGTPGQRVPGEEGFGETFARALSAGLKIGVLLDFDPCTPADPQSALFVQMVPREEALLRPAIALSRTAEACPSPVSDAAVESELLILINQIERHAGKPVILKLSRAFEDKYATARSTARDLWLERDRARPDYAGRPWLLWSANSQLVTEASEEPLEWVVVQK